MNSIPPATPPVTPAAGSAAPQGDGRDRNDINWDSVAKAHVRTVDALAGFDKMVEKAEPRFRPVAERFQTLHRRHAGELARILADAGQAVEAEGSFMGTVNRAVVATRAVFDEVDEDVMDEVRRGEQNVVRAFEEALDQPLAPAPREAVSRMLAELNDLIAETRHLD